MPFYFLVLVSTSSNQPSRLNTSVFILRWTSFLTSSTSSGVKSSSSILFSSCVSDSTSSSDSKVSSTSLSSSNSVSLSTSVSSVSFSSDVAISITSLSLVILSLILGEMSSGFFTFFLEVKLYQRFLLVCHHCFYVENYSLPQLKVILLTGQTRK